MKRQDVLLGAVGVAGALVGAGCVSDDEAVARDSGADLTSATASPTPSRPPRERVFATYEASDQYGSDVIRFRVENANEYAVRVTLSATWWRSDGTIALERTSNELSPHDMWEGGVSHSGGDASVSRWDASVESVTRV